VVVRRLNTKGGDPSITALGIPPDRLHQGYGEFAGALPREGERRKLADTYNQSFPVWAAQVVAMSVAFAWLYAKSGGSLAHQSSSRACSRRPVPEGARPQWSPARRPAHRPVRNPDVL
jgi:hypothetical protein